VTAFATPSILGSSDPPALGSTPVPGVLARLRSIHARFRQDQGFLMASAISFAALLCLAPLTLILFSIAGYLMESDTIAEFLFDAATLLLPAYGRELGEFFSFLTRERAVVGLVGVLSWAIFATQFFSLMRTVLNRIFRAPARRGIVHGFAIDLLMVVVIGSLAILFAVTILVVVTVGDVALGAGAAAAGSSRWLRRLVSIPLMYLMGVGLLFLLFRTLPNIAVPARAATLATLAVAVGWEAARWLFTAYVVTFGTYGSLYGSFGAGIAALVWIYYSAVIFVLGGELAAVLAARES
jgi:membrane protein